ncbi:ankyrin repeat domain-containing protein 33B-like [Saccostrea echinata]|uniref:ankyrin repeat domain-containing protein 33B-like n=1 Tax=Saccostrea echinata TaxID=191078 RepID=UPI002A816772|nr:ankyrin repeat domain-containing protein 33B-like [Saccostrea echinata]
MFSDEFYDEYTLLEACLEYDFEAVQNILDDSPTDEELNERDKSGKTALCHACASGMLPIVQLLSEVPEVDVNLSDKEGNSPLIFAAQAGYREIVRVLLHEFRKIRVDHKNKAGFTALMKAALQGRTSCAKLLLYAGANPKLRDNGRQLCAEEWARFTGRHECADEIAKFTKTKRFLFNRSSKKVYSRSSSVPDLTATDDKVKEYTGPTRQKSKSFRKKIKRMIHGSSNNNTNPSYSNHLTQESNPFAIVARCVSTPALSSALPGGDTILKRPRSIDNIPRVEVTSPVATKTAW